MSATRSDLLGELDRLAKNVDDELVAFRRDLHQHPELGGREYRTTQRIADRLDEAGITWRRLEMGTGVVADIAAASGAAGAPVVALRADIDALPLADPKDVAYRSTVPGVTHACGHDAHTSAVLGAGLVLAEMRAAGTLPGGVRLIFQPAEETIPGGAEDVIADGGIDGVQRIYGLHCDPSASVGHVGLRVGGLTASADKVTVIMHGPGGHTARPHLTQDVVYALAEVATQLPGIVSRRFDPRSGISVVWGAIAAGAAPNVIPQSGELSGTVRTLDVDTWVAAEATIPELIRQITAPLGVEPTIAYDRGVPPVMNDAQAIATIDHAARDLLGDEAVVPAPQSLGGEDFAWYLEHVPGAMFRLGVRAPGVTAAADLHRAEFDLDERAIGIGSRVLALAALDALAELAEGAPAVG